MEKSHEELEKTAKEICKQLDGLSAEECRHVMSLVDNILYQGYFFKAV